MKSHSRKRNQNRLKLRGWGQLGLNPIRSQRLKRNELYNYGERHKKAGRLGEYSTPGELLDSQIKRNNAKLKAAS